MHSSLSRPRAVAAVATAVALGAATVAGYSSEAHSALPQIFGGVHPTAGAPGDESHELMDALAQWNGARTAPSPDGVAPGAYGAAYDHLAAMPATGTTFTELTDNYSYDSDNVNYSDQVWSNAKGGSRTVTGRITALATDPADNGTIYAGGANGGVFRSTTDGAAWTAIADHLPALGAGALLVAPDKSLWLGTGEGNTNSDSYVGSGVYRMPAGGTAFTSDQRVGGDELESHTIRQLRLAGAYVYAATSRGLYRHVWDTSSPSFGSGWDLVLAPCSGVGTAAIACSGGTSYQNIANDVTIDQQTGELVAAMGWRGGSGGGTEYNGFYDSSDGVHWTRANPTGAINPQDIGNATLAYSNDGSKLYAVVESVKALLHNQASLLAGIYVSPTGDPNGPWNQAASSGTLATSGSALKTPATGHGYQPGVQAWYNQFVGVDPRNADHVYVGLEEVYESWDAGQHWTTTGRYWNFGLKCFAFDPSADTCDGNVMHSDQHAIAFGNGQVYVGNDGGVYARTTSAKVGWRDLSAGSGIDTLQYYGADVGAIPGGGTAVWGGLQDNGQSLLVTSGAHRTKDANGNTEMVSPVGGDGGIQMVNKANGCQSLGEYVDLELLYTDHCGETAADGTPQRIFDISPKDPDARFIAPFGEAVNDPGYWVAGGSLVYADTNTWPDTSTTTPSSSDWQVLNDNGNVAAGVFHPTTAVTAIKVGDSHVVYAGWCSGSCAPNGFKRGLATNFGGSWHQLNLSQAGIPNSYISDLRADPSDPSGGTVYMTLSGFSRKWQSGPGAGYGHVWKSIDGGVTWSNLDGLAADGSYAGASSFPDIPANQIRIAPDGDLLVSTDLGLVVHRATAGDGVWERVGPAAIDGPGSLPNVPVVSVAWGGGDNLAYVATHGRGIWTIPDAAL